MGARYTSTSQMRRTSMVPLRAPSIAEYLRSDFDRFVEVVALGQAVAADLLLGLSKPEVRNQDLAVASLDGRRVARRAQTRARS